MDKVELVFVLIVSIFLLFIPFVIYLFVRSGERCRNCRKKSLVPLSSPVARSALGVMELKPQSVQTLVQPAPPRMPLINPGSGVAWRMGNFVNRHPIWAVLLAFILILWVARALGVTSSLQEEEDKAVVRQREQLQAVAEANRQTEQKNAEAFKGLTARQHLTAARAILKPTASKSEIVEAMRHLDTITTISSEYASARPLRKAAESKLDQLDQKENAQKLEEEMRAHPQNVLAGIVCEAYVKDILKAPATADFQSFLGRNVTDLGKWRYTVSSYVDSQNSFGAKIRTSFTCDVQCVGQNKCAVIGFSSSP